MSDSGSATESFTIGISREVDDTASALEATPGVTAQIPVYDLCSAIESMGFPQRIFYPETGVLKLRGHEVTMAISIAEGYVAVYVGDRIYYKRAGHGHFGW